MDVEPTSQVDTEENTAALTRQSSSDLAGPSDSHQQPAPPPLPSNGTDEAESFTNGQSSTPTANIQVFGPALTPPAMTTPTTELDSAFFEPTLSDVQSHHSSVVARSKRLNEAPLLTAKHRDAERAEKDKRKAERWPETTIRIKFSDGTQVQSKFASTSPIQPVYAFVRSTLESSSSSKPFVLWQPPRNQYPEHPAPVLKKTNPHKTTIMPPAQYGAVRGSLAQGLQGGTGGDESLADLGLVPQSMLMIRWEDESMNASGYPAPILEDLKAKTVPLPIPQPNEAGEGSSSDKKPKPPQGAPGEKKIPKWLQKGLMKRK